MSNLAGNLSRLNATSSGAIISCAQLEMEAGGLVSELCAVRFAFKSLGLTLNEFVTLKVIAMTSIVANVDTIGSGSSGSRQQQDNQHQPDIADPSSVLRIRDRYLKALVSYLVHKKPPLGPGTCSAAALTLNGTGGNTALGPNTGHVLARMNSLLNLLAQVSSAANLLLQSKMFYVPFLMNCSSNNSNTSSSSNNSSNTGTLSATNINNNSSSNGHHAANLLSSISHFGLAHYDRSPNINIGSNRNSSSSPPSSAPVNSTGTGALVVVVNSDQNSSLTNVNQTSTPTPILAGTGSNCN